MKRLPSETCGLTIRQERHWKFVQEFQSKHGRGPTAGEVSCAMKAFDKYPTPWLVLNVCIKRNFVRFNSAAQVFEALEPPHEKVLRETVALTGVTRAEILGDNRARHVVRARKIVTRRLVKAGYLHSDIRCLLNKNHSTIYEYIYPLKRMARVVRRSRRTANEARAA